MNKNRKTILTLIFCFLVIGGFFYFKKYNTYQYEKLGFLPLPEMKPPHERKIPTEQKLKIGIITDTHVHPRRVDQLDRSSDMERYLSPKQVAPIRAFVEEMKSFQPDLIVHVGDVIEGTGEEEHVGKMGLELVKQELEKAGVPILWVLGNHELRSISKEQFKEQLGIDYLNGVLDEGDYRLIVLDANHKKAEDEKDTDEKPSSGLLPDETLSWLEEQLRTDKHTLIFCHYALFDQIFSGERGAARLSLEPGDKTRQLLSDYNVTGYFNGHIEYRRFEEKDGVRYFSLPGTKKSRTYPGSFYELTVQGDEPKVKMFYQSEAKRGEYVSVDFSDPDTFLELVN